jgi:hypothetical protein
LRVSAPLSKSQGLFLRAGGCVGAVISATPPGVMTHDDT